MNKERIKLLVEALRSGDYRQGKYAMYQSDGTHCIEGVMCDISGLGTWQQNPEFRASKLMMELLKMPERRFDYKTPTFDHVGYLTDNCPVLAWYGLAQPIRLWGKQTVAVEKGKKAVEELLPARYFNDAENWSFGRLAAAIEKEYLG